MTTMTKAKQEVAINSYASAHERFSERTRAGDSIKLCPNTWLVQGAIELPHQESEPPWYAIRFHNTNVVTYYADGDVQLDTGGWRTVSTRDRIRHYLPGGQWPTIVHRPFIRWSLRVEKGKWFLDCVRICHMPNEVLPDGTVDCNSGRYDRKTIKSYPFDGQRLYLRKSRTAGGFSLGEQL